VLFPTIVIPAKAGTHPSARAIANHKANALARIHFKTPSLFLNQPWVPAFAGMTI
jgi:hypothetical protein